MTFNLLTGPIPGQSLTREPGARPYEGAPQYTTVDEAMESILPKVFNPDVSLNMADMMEDGMPATGITETFLSYGVMEGKWSVDLAILLALPLYEAVIKSVELSGRKVVRGSEKEFRGAANNVLMDKVKRDLSGTADKAENALFDRETTVGEGIGVGAESSDIPEKEGIM